jgi:hypothetical protein
MLEEKFLALGANEKMSNQRARVMAGVPQQALQRSKAKTLPEHRGYLYSPLALRIEPIDSRLDQALN